MSVMYIRDCLSLEIKAVKHILSHSSLKVPVLLVQAYKAFTVKTSSSHLKQLCTPGSNSHSLFCDVIYCESASSGTKFTCQIC